MFTPEKYGSAAIVGVATSPAGAVSGLNDVFANDNAFCSIEVVNAAFKGAAASAIDITGFGFSIPTGARIISTRIRIRAYRTAGTSASMTIQGALRGGTFTPNAANTAFAAIPVGTTGDTEVEYVSSAFDTTVFNPSVSDINSSGFGVRIDTRGGDIGSTYIYFDSVTIQIEYAPLVSVNDLGNAQTIGNGTASQGYAIALNDVNQASAIVSPALVQAHSASINEVIQAQGVDSVSSSLAHILALDSLNNAHLLDTVALTQNNVVTADDIEQTQGVAAAVLAAAYSVNLDDLSQAIQAGNIDITVSGGMAIDAIRQAVQADDGQVNQAHIVSIARVDQSQTAGSPSGDVFYVITPEGIEQISTLEAVSAIADGALTPVDITQVQSTNVALAAVTALGQLNGEILIYTRLAGSVDISPAINGNIILN